MASFDVCFPFLLANEDFTPPRYEVVPDNVGHVVSGINSTKWPREFAFIAATPLDQRPDAVKAFYRQKFWNTWLDQVDSNRIAAMILDASVNQGQGWAVKFAQIAAGLTESAVDGHWGPITLAAVNGASEGDFVPKFITAREDRYRQIGGASLPAWLARATKVPQFA